MIGKLLLLTVGTIIILIPTVQSDERVLAGNDTTVAHYPDKPEIDNLISSFLKRIDPESIKSFMEDLVSFKTRFMLADNRRDIAVWIRDKFKSFGYENTTIDSFQNKLEFPLNSGKYHTTWQYNVVANLNGTENPGSVYVLGAHYDCFIMGPDTDPHVYSPGANNNSSGVAACLEIARILKESGFQPKCTIRFVAFGAEEFMTLFAEGTSGSEYFVSQISKSNQKVALLIDNNQISYAPSSEKWQVDFQNYPGSEWVTDLAHYLCTKFTKIIPVDTNDHINYTDAYYFWKAGYPAIFFEEFHFCPHTFTARDIVENCNVFYCAEVAKISCAILLYCNY